MVDNKYNDLDEVALVFQRVFKTDDGKDVLAVLEAMFDKKALIQNAADGVAMSNLTFARIGEQNVVKYIKSLVERKITND